MDTQEIIERLEAEWDLTNGFLGRLREGTFEPAGLLRFEQLLGSIQLDQKEPLNPRLVALIWYVPIFMSWQRERVQECGGNAQDYELACNRILIIVEQLLGVP